MMMEMLSSFEPTRFAEQDFLNTWYRGKWNMLPTTYNWGKPNMYLCPELIGSTLHPLKVVHFSGRLKPWHSREPTEEVALAHGAPLGECVSLANPQASLVRDAIARWWAAYDYDTEAPAADRPEMATKFDTTMLVSKKMIEVDKLEVDETKLTKAATPEEERKKVLFAVHRFYPYEGTFCVTRIWPALIGLVVPSLTHIAPFPSSLLA